MSSKDYECLFFVLIILIFIFTDIFGYVFKRALINLLLSFLMQCKELVRNNFFVSPYVRKYMCTNWQEIPNPNNKLTMLQEFRALCLRLKKKAALYVV